MFNSRTADINWSFGDNPNWEFEQEQGLKSVAER